MSEFLELILVLAVLIFIAKLGGYISLRLGQPSVLGELLAGVILGPSMIDLLHLPFFHDDHLGTTISELAELGVLLLMFIAGLDLHLTDLAKSRKVAVLAGTLGVLVPVVMGFVTGVAFNMASVSALFLGLILAATSVSISAQTLMELNVLRSRVGVTLLGAAVFDDILVVLALSVLIALSLGGSGLASIGLVSLQMISYLVVASAIGLWLLPRLSHIVAELPVSRGLVSFTFVVMLVFAWTAEIWGHMAAITGAFLAGLMFARSPHRDSIASNMGTLAYGVFVPIFFINVGLSANVRDLSQDIWLVVAMIGVAIISKILGAGLGARIAGFTNLESLQLGVGMMSRGEVGLIVANLGIAQGIISPRIFSAVVGVVIVTTLLTPPMLHGLFARRGRPVPKAQEIKT